jgi:ubiquinone biosynthesis protein COQ9
MPDAEQAAVMPALLQQVPAHGWTMAALREALIALGRPAAEAALIFPNGTGEMIEAFCALADKEMEDPASAAALAELRVPARVRAIIALRLSRNRPHKHAIRRALRWLALPGNGALAARITAQTVDAVWHAAGDTAADFSWYSKRGILAGVYGATLLFWLRDASEDDAATLAFLDRRLADVARIGKLRKKLQTKMA